VKLRWRYDAAVVAAAEQEEEDDEIYFKFVARNLNC
jgi:hypothetical protein